MCDLGSKITRSQGMYNVENTSTSDSQNYLS